MPLEQPIGNENLDHRPTYQDAQLLLSLYELRRETKFRQARQWFLSSFLPQTAEEFLSTCPSGSEQETFFRMVYSYWEMAASLVTAGILNEELFVHNSSELLQVWERIRILVPEWRRAWNNPQTVKHMEEVAFRAERYLNSGHPEAHATFVANTGLRPKP
jgi:hypothetical protein